MIKMTFEFGSPEQAHSFLSAVSEYQNSPVVETPVVEAAEDTDADGQPNPPETGKTEEQKKASETLEKSKGRRRRRTKAEMAEEEEKPKGRRSRKPKAEEAKEEEEAPAPEELSDVDVAKAASEAAKVLGVQKVLDELHAYEVEKVSELGPLQRKDFVATLRDLLNPESEEAANPAFS